jgi:hypothetical protein
MFFEKNPIRDGVERRLWVGAIICALSLVLGYFVLVKTSRGHRIDNAAYSGRDAVLSQEVSQFHGDLLDLVKKKGLLLAAGFLLVLAAYRRCFWVGVIAVVAFGCAVVGAELLKHALSWSALIPGDAHIRWRLKENTYPSGHATIGTSYVLALLLVSSVRWRPWVVVGGGAVAAAIAMGVFTSGWHRASDALGALAWSGLCMTLAAVVATRLKGRFRPFDLVYPGRAACGGWIAIGVFLVSVFFAVAIGLTDNAAGDLLFYELTGLIVFSAFALTGWYGWSLQAIEFEELGPWMSTEGE